MVNVWTILDGKLTFKCDTVSAQWKLLSAICKHPERFDDELQIVDEQQEEDDGDWAAEMKKFWHPGEDAALNRLREQKS